MTPEIQIISIEGNIGSGKSTLLANLQKHFKNNHNVIFLKEPVDEWSEIKDENGITILEKFYADQEKYSFSFQIMAYISRLKILKNVIKNCRDEASTVLCDQPNTEKSIYYIITERSLFTDKMVFAKMLYESGKIELINYHIYLNWFNTFVDDYKVNKVIYVKATPDVCYERIKKRHRDGENNISLEYLTTCHRYHENMLDKTLYDCVSQRQLILDGDIDIYKNHDIINKWISTIENYIFGLRLKYPSKV